MKFKHEKEKGSGRRKRHFGEEKNLDISITNIKKNKDNKGNEKILNNIILILNNTVLILNNIKLDNL